MKVIIGYFTKHGPLYEEEQEFASLEEASSATAETVLIRDNTKTNEAISFKTLEGVYAGLPLEKLEYFLCYEAEQFYAIQNQVRAQMQGES